jgi:hypothetical protein
MATSEVPYSECGSFKEIYDHVTAGIPPAALANVEHVELRAFIQTCLRKPANRPTAAELLEQPFLYEVPPLKVFVAYAILANEQLMTAAKTSLSPDDMNFLTVCIVLSPNADGWPHGTLRDWTDKLMLPHAAGSVVWVVGRHGQCAEA